MASTRPAEPAARLFLSLRPPTDVIGQLEALRRPDRRDLRWTPAPNWHITLRYLGVVSSSAVVSAVDGIAPLPGATVALGPTITTLGRPVIVPAQGLGELAGALRRATEHLGGDERPFVGHLTLAWLRSADQRCRLVGQPFGATFPVRAVELLASHPGRTDRRYETRHRWSIPDDSMPSSAAGS